MSDITSKSLTELASLIRTRQVSPVEVVEAHLRRIEELNPSLNAVVTLADDALERARDAERNTNGAGVLHGLPVTIKDTIETKGLRSTSGSLMREHFVPAMDAPSVARLKNAGAIILAKTNPAEMAMDYNGDNPLFGRTNHPQDHRRTPGGSSAGEAAAISVGMSPGGLGTDLAGSIRIPAHFCGITGLKPGTGRVPGEGQFPPSTGPYSLGAVIGPMARTVDDLKLLFSVLSASAPSNRSIDDSRSSLKSARVAWYTHDGTSPVTSETAAAVERVARLMNECGMDVNEARPPGVERGNELWMKTFSRASVVQLRKVYAGNEDKGGDFVRWRLATADDIPPPGLDEYISNWMERDRARAELLAWMEEVPFLIAPVGAVPAFEHGALKITVNGETFGTFKAFSYCQAFNVFDLPVVVVPASRISDGLPMGVQLVGRPNEEERLLDLASVVLAMI